MRCALVAKSTCTRVRGESTGTKNTGYHIIREYFQSVMPCLPEHLFSLDFIYFEAVKTDILRSCSKKKMKDFQGPKTKFKYFQGLEIGLLKFKGFQGLSRRVRTLTNVNTPFFQVPTLGFGHSAGVNFYTSM